MDFLSSQKSNFAESKSLKMHLYMNLPMSHITKIGPDQFSVKHLLDTDNQTIYSS